MTSIKKLKKIFSNHLTNRHFHDILQALKGANMKNTVNDSIIRKNLKAAEMAKEAKKEMANAKAQEAQPTKQQKTQDPKVMNESKTLMV